MLDDDMIKENWFLGEKKIEIIWIECRIMYELLFKCDYVLINSCVDMFICVKCVGSIWMCKDFIKIFFFLEFF